MHNSCHVRIAVGSGPGLRRLSLAGGHIRPGGGMAHPAGLAAGGRTGASGLVDTIRAQLLASRGSAAALGLIGSCPVDQNTKADSGRGLIRGFASIGAGTLVSRVSGFAREVVTAALFGAGTEMDIFVAAFTIPNLLCRVLGESSVESGFMPLFKGTHAAGETGRAWRLAARTANWLAIALTAITLAGVAAAPFLVSVVAHGFEGDVARATVRMTRLMFPFGVAIGLAALMGAILLAFGRFRVYSLAPVLLNVGIIGSVLALSGSIGYVSLAVGVLVGGFLQFAVQVPFVRALAGRDGERAFRAELAPGDRDVRRVAGLTAPVVVESLVQRAGVIVDRTIASFLVPGSISSLYYSFRLVHLPYAILALAAGRSVAPALAERYALGDREGFAGALLTGIRMNAVFLAPVSVLAVALSRPVVGLVYQRGAFDETDLAMTSAALAMYSVGLVGMGLTFLLVRAFAAMLDTKTPVKVSVVTFFLNAGLNLVLVRTPLRHAGLALASSIAFAAHAVILYLILNRRLERDSAAIERSEMVRLSWKVGASCLALVAAFAVVDRLVGIRFAELLQMGRIVRILLAGGAGVAAYLAVSRLLGLGEVGDLLRLGRGGRRA
ncbi:MAG: murein biosynthesis integral membrane protein MurJ [Candidatus Eisenbacteria bacterium]|nr:murein biosynthesis integral membrane protein MurJ [Candidatus Eisenbacteria bacterium]